MSDKELLELAAKAAGVEINWSSPFVSIGDFAQVPDWNPLTDDGDALRLAVKLDLLEPEVIDDWEWCRGNSEYSDICSNYRRTIVHAAAEIGRSTK